MNQEIKNNVIPINQDVLNSISKYDSIGTIKNILRDKQVTYHNAKKIVSDIKNNKFGEGDFSLLLSTLETGLTTMRDGNKTSKKVEMNSGMQNRFLSSHNLIIAFKSSSHCQSLSNGIVATNSSNDTNEDLFL